MTEETIQDAEFASVQFHAQILTLLRLGLAAEAISAALHAQASALAESVRTDLQVSNGH